MDEVEQLAETLYRRTQEARGFKEPGNLTLSPKNLPGHQNCREVPGERDAWVGAIRQALADDVIRIGNGDPQGSIEENMEAR